jgi:hypothetical protein
MLSVGADRAEAMGKERRRRLGFTLRGGGAHERHSGYERARWRRLGATYGLYSLGAKLKKEGGDRGKGFSGGVFGRQRLRRLGEEDDGADGEGQGVSGRERTGRACRAGPAASWAWPKARRGERRARLLRLRQWS